MANTSFLYPVIKTETDNVGNINKIDYQLFLPQNKLIKFSSSYIKKNDINDLQPSNPTKFDTGVSSSDYLQYKLKYYKHTAINKSSYTNYILGSDKSFSIKILDPGKNYNKDIYPIKIYTNTISNTNSCWICCSLDNNTSSSCNECNKILDIPIYANTYNGKISSIDIFPFYISNNKIIDNSKLLYRFYSNLVISIPDPDTDINNSKALLVLSINKNKQHLINTFNKIIPNETGLNSSTELQYRKKHSSSDFNIGFNKKYKRFKKIYRFLYRNANKQIKLQENFSIPIKIDNYNFNPRIRFKKSKHKFGDYYNHSSRGLSQSSLLTLKTNYAITTTRQININNSIPSSQYLNEQIMYNNKNYTTSSLNKITNNIFELPPMSQ